MKRLFCLIMLCSLGVSASAPEYLYVYLPSLSTKNLKDFQQVSDQWNGIKFLGFCHDLSVAQFYIDRSTNPTDSALFSQFKKNGIVDFEIKNSVLKAQFEEHCTHFEPRQ